MQIHSFSHGDVDGAVSNLLVQKYYDCNGSNFKVEFCNYRNIDARIESFLNSNDYNEGIYVVLTDIFPSPEVLDALNRIPNRKLAIDHHQTSMDEIQGKNFDWVKVDTRFSATKLVFQHFVKGSDTAGVARIKEYGELVRIVNLLDVGDRSSDEFLKNIDMIVDLSSFFSASGVSAFRRRFAQKANLFWNEIEKTTITTVEKFRQDVLRRLNPQEIESACGNYKYVVAFASDYQSDIPEHVLRTRNEFAFIIIVDMNDARFSLRRNDNNSFGAGLDLAKIAEHYGGGGHPFAAGFEGNDILQALEYLEEFLHGKIRGIDFDVSF
jgi:oligoribonuclease NrnB/cAMP/cGMP phosphodiesterase (DHH superfamily)